MNLTRMAFQGATLAMLCAGMALHASGYGWVATITNNGSYPVVVQSSDNGFNGKLILGDGPCVAGSSSASASIGCAPYVLLPGDSLKARDYVLPWQNHGGTMTIKILRVDSTGAPDPITYQLQERDGKMTLLKEHNVTNQIARSGDTFYNVVIGNDKQVTVSGSSKRPDWWG